MDYYCVFSDYVSTNNLNSENVVNFITNTGFVNFYNEITKLCLGQYPKFDKNKSKTTSSLVYVPDVAKEKLIQHMDILYVANLYVGVIISGNLKFNYPNYEVFLKNLINLRNELKIKNKKTRDEKDMVVILLIKTYINTVYGMLDNPQSVVSSKLENPREYVVETAKNIILAVVSFLLNKSIPVYYIDCDEIYIPKLTTQLIKDLKNNFKKECGSIIDTSISSVIIDDEITNKSAYIIDKKKMIVYDDNKCTTTGLTLIDDEKVLIQNKKFFGRNHAELFPEYTLWA